MEDKAIRDRFERARRIMGEMDSLQSATDEQLERLSKELGSLPFTSVPKNLACGLIFEMSKREFKKDNANKAKK